MDANRIRWAATAAVVAHLVLVQTAFNGLRWEHALAGLLFAAPAWCLGVPGRRWTVAAFPLWLTAAVYESVSVLAPYRLGDVHVGDLYAAERALFGVGDVVLSEWFAVRTHPAADFLAGTAYLLYLAEPIGLWILFFFTRPTLGRRLAWAFLFTNLLGVAGYLLYPAAPPLYVAVHGTGPADLSAAPSAAGALRFDALLGISYFESFYARNPNVFGAMPSLHAAYPLLCLLAVRGMSRAVIGGAAAFLALASFAAVYLQHHYVLDLLGGYACAAAAWWTSSRLPVKPRC